MAAVGTLRRVGAADSPKAKEILQEALTVESTDSVKRALTSALESLQKPHLTRQSR